MAASRGVEGGHAMRVVQLALLLITENLVSLGDGFELDFGFRTLVLGDFVGMVEKSQL